MPQRLTIRDYRETPEGPPWYQLIEGALVQDPSPTSAHQAIVTNLASLLGTYVRSNRLGRVFVAPLDVYLSDQNVFQPDLIYVSAKREGIIAKDGLHRAPDLAVEVLSPSSRRRDQTQKLKVYAFTGTRECWLIDPEARQLNLYRLATDGPRLDRVVAASESFASDLFPGLTLAAADIFDFV